MDLEDGLEGCVLNCDCSVVRMAASLKAVQKAAATGLKASKTIASTVAMTAGNWAEHKVARNR